MIGVIDIGTNSVKLAVGYTAEGRVLCSYVAREPTRIGRGLSLSGRISADSIRRTAVAVSRLAAEARRRGAVDVIAVGTYAFRAAKNGREAARAIGRATSVPVRILSGQEEAAMVLRSVRARVRPRSGRIMVLDIGGGSAEFIVATDQRAVMARSVPLGAVRLTEKFLKCDPIAPEEYAQLNEYIARVAARLFAHIDARDSQLVVSGGTATTAMSMLGLRGNDQGSAVRVAMLRRLELRCLSSTISQRRHFRGLPPDRADIMPAGLAVLLAFARHAGKRSLRLVEGGVRDGVMLQASEKAVRSRPRSKSRVRAKAAVRKGR